MQSKQLLPSLIRYLFCSFSYSVVLWMHVLSFTVTILPNKFYLEMRRRLKASVKLLVFPVLYNCSQCWHTRENWTNISICGFMLRTLLYIVHQFINIRSLREWHNIHQIDEFSRAWCNWHKFSRRYRSSDSLETREFRSFVAIKLTSICRFILQTNIRGSRRKIPYYLWGKCVHWT